MIEGEGGSLTTEPALCQGKYSCFCKSSSSRQAVGTSWCNFVFPFVLATIYICIFATVHICIFLQGRLLCLGEPDERVDVTIEKTAFSLVKSRLALGSPGCLFVCLGVTMPKRAQYTEKWLLTAPWWSNPKVKLVSRPAQISNGAELVKPVFCLVDTGSCSEPEKAKTFWIGVILRCWGKSSMVCQQKSDAL